MKLERDSAILLDNKVKVLSLFVIDALYLSAKRQRQKEGEGKRKEREREGGWQVKGVFDEMTKNCVFGFKQCCLSAKKMDFRETFLNQHLKGALKGILYKYGYLCPKHK